MNEIFMDGPSQKWIQEHGNPLKPEPCQEVDELKPLQAGDQIDPAAGQPTQEQPTFEGIFVAPDQVAEIFQRIFGPATDALRDAQDEDEQLEIDPKDHFKIILDHAQANFALAEDAYKLTGLMGIAVQLIQDGAILHKEILRAKDHGRKKEKTLRMVLMNHLIVTGVGLMMLDNDNFEGTL